jgi:type II secretory pathway pseudopilin PulG
LFSSKGNKEGGFLFMYSRQNERGFTLIEVLVSVAILMLIILGIAATLTTSIRADTLNQDRHVADKLAQGVLEKIVDFAAQGSANFSAFIANNFNGAMPNQLAITGVRPAILAEPANDRIYNDFNGDGAADYGIGTKTIYVYQLLIDDISVGGQTGLLKRVTVRIYYADQSNPAQARVDLRKHADPGGAFPRRFGSPLSETCTYVALP